MYAVLTPIFCFIAFLFLLLVSISVPIVKTIYLFSLSTTTTSSLQIDFGVWGYCIPSVRYGFAGIYKTTSAYCSPAHLGWTFDEKVASYLGAVKTLENTISTATTLPFVLHPVAAALSFLTFIVSLFLLRAKPANPQRITSIITFVLGSLAVAVTTIAFLVDVIVVGILKGKVRDDTDGLVLLNYGNAVWLTLVAAIALWLAIIGACCGVFQRRRKSKTNTY